MFLVFGRPPRKDRSHEIPFKLLFKKPQKPKLGPMTPSAAGIEAHEMSPGETPPGKAVPPLKKGIRLRNCFIEGALRDETM